MTDITKQHFYHHRWCHSCEKMTVHDSGKCTVCDEGARLKCDNEPTASPESNTVLLHRPPPSDPE